MQPGGAAEGRQQLADVVSLMEEVLGKEHNQTSKYAEALQAIHNDIRMNKAFMPVQDGGLGLPRG